MYKGDIIENINPSSKRYGEQAEVTDVTSSHVHVEYDDGDIGKCKISAVSRYYKVIDEATDLDDVDGGCSGRCGAVSQNTNNQTNKPKNMKKIVEFAKSLILSADEKLLRKVGLKDECGDYTREAIDIVIEKLVHDNEQVLIDLATAMEAERKADKNS